MLFGVLGLLNMKKSSYAPENSSSDLYVLHRFFSTSYSCSATRKTFERKMSTTFEKNSRFSLKEVNNYVIRVYRYITEHFRHIDVQGHENTPRDGSKRNLVNNLKFILEDRDNHVIRPPGPLKNVSDIVFLFSILKTPQ